MNYNSTILELKEKKLLMESDKCVFCRYDQPFSFGAFFGALGGMMTVAWSKVDYLLAANEETFKIFNINKKTGEFTGEHIELKKDQIDKLVCKKYLLGNIRIIVRSKRIKPKINFFTCNTFRGFEQTENKNTFVDFLQTHFTKQVGKKALN